MSPYLPITPDQITAEAVAAAEAGAAIIHLHARDPETGKPDPTPERFMEFLPRIKQQTDAILNVTTGGGQGMTLEERFAAALIAKPELASMNMGSFNFALFEAVDRIPAFKHDWEKPYLENSKNFILSNTFAQIEYGMRALGEHGTRFEFECYEVSHLYNLAFFADRGLVKPPFFIQCIFGILGGIGPDPENLIHMRGVADRLFGKDYQLSVLGPASTRCRSPRSAPSWAATCGSVSRTACSSDEASSRSRTPSRSPRSAASSRSSGSTSPRRRRRGRSSGPRAPRTSPSDPHDPTKASNMSREETP